jgi:hypothetical protein
MFGTRVFGPSDERTRIKISKLSIIIIYYNWINMQIRGIIPLTKLNPPKEKHMMLYSNAEANLVLEQARNRLSLLYKGFIALAQERELDSVEQEDATQVQNLLISIQEADTSGKMADLELQLIVEDTNRIWEEVSFT